MRHLIVLVRPGCHLCHALVADLRQLQAARRFTFEEVDVDSDPELADSYGVLIPVVLVDGREICRYRFDGPAIIAALDE